jgi:hypothetical protein
MILGRILKSRANEIVDIDCNIKDPQFCASIAHEIYENLRASEVCHHLFNVLESSVVIIKVIAGSVSSWFLWCFSRFRNLLFVFVTLN